MKLDNFKELLLKKSENNKGLQVLIKHIKDDYLLDYVVESLEKMAQAFSKKNPNAALLDFGANMDEHTEPDMFRDALSHHASHYKAALKDNNKPLANKHAHQIFKMMHMADKLTRDGLNDHSNNKLRVEAVHPMPWERSAYTTTNDQGKFKTDTKGWAAHTRGSNPSYDFLSGAPHEAYKKEVKTHGHNKAYPLEHMKVNDEYINVEDIKSPGKFEPHSFDKHPIMSNFTRSPKDHDSMKQDDYLKQLDGFNSTDMNSYYDMAEAKGKNIKNKGMSAPVHGDIAGLDLTDSHQPQKAEAVSPEQKLPDQAPSLQDIKAKLAAIKGNK